VSETTHGTTEHRTTERAGPRARPVRLPHAPEGIPDRAGRFLGLLDRSRRDERPASA
jgi:hypothetical protein